jgi:phosphoribosyl 1,2-cyclic phosphodiesterase/DNA-binding response OmpR family regulator
MLLRFWGTRGSIATPGMKTIRYGGNTSCIELRSSKGTLIVIDCGTGAYALGRKLLEKNTGSTNGNLIIGHTHWDHIQGVPFFAPLFVPGNKWNIYGPKGLGHSIQETLAGQMQHTYFPVGLDQLSATLNYHDLVEGEFFIDDIKITAHYLNHTMLTCGYRFEVDGLTVVYACDHEPYSKELAYGKGNITGRDRLHADFLTDADLVIHDAQYLAKEYAEKIGWGHSTIEYVVKICQYANVKRLVLTHHDPSRTDDQLDQLLQTINNTISSNGSLIEISAAAEGQEIVLTPKKEGTIKPVSPISDPIEQKSALTVSNILVCADNKKLDSFLKETINSDDVSITFVSNSPDIRIEDANKNKTILSTLRKKFLPDNIIKSEIDVTSQNFLKYFKTFEKNNFEKKFSLVFLEHNPPDLNAFTLCRAIRKQNKNIPIILIASKEDRIIGDKVGVTDWLIMPFNENYVKSKIHSWLLQKECRWIVAPMPKNESERMAAVKKLNMLDTEKEERFDRITRIAAALFDVPIVAITLMDKDREWFKSSFGTYTKEISRDISFCSHIVAQNKTIILTDAYQDERFADNPLVLNEPHIRFYAACPLIMKDGACIGALFLIDMRPRYFLEKDIKLLEDLRDLTVVEFENPDNCTMVKLKD